MAGNTRSRHPRTIGAPKTMRVKWEIDIDAATPEEAARKALAIQRDPESIATFFDVNDGSGLVTRVELDPHTNEKVASTPEVVQASGTAMQTFKVSSDTRLAEGFYWLITKDAPSSHRLDVIRVQGESVRHVGSSMPITFQDSDYDEVEVIGPLDDTRINPSAHFFHRNEMPPCQDGYYWLWRDPDSSSGEVVEVLGSTVWFVDDGRSHNLHEQCRCNFELAGPIEPPGCL